MIDIRNAKHDLINFIADKSFTNISKIKEDSMIFREGIFDSMGLMSLITYLEENYDIKIEDSDLIEENFESINAIYKFLEKKL